MLTNNCLDVEVIDLKSIDRDAYILKLKMMTAFNKAFATNFDLGDADSIHFRDILMAPAAKYRRQVYPLLKKAVRHGISPVLKDKLYCYDGIMFANRAGGDFDDYLEEISPQLDGMGDNIAVVDFLSVNGISVARGYYCVPFCFIEYCVEIPEGSLPETETFLVQNGFGMIVRLVNSLESIDFVSQAQEVTAYDYEDDDEESEDVDDDSDVEGFEI